MEIQNRIEKISQYFKGMEVRNIEGANIIYIVVQFPTKWVLDTETTREKYKVEIGSQESNGRYFFCTEMSNGFDNLFDAIDYNVESMIAIEERNKLFDKKEQELEELFNNKTISLDKLKTLTFTFNDNVQRITIPEKALKSVEAPEKTLPETSTKTEDNSKKNKK